MAGLGDNPFTILTAVAAPAVLTNACSVLSLGTGNRLGRVVDRTRVVTATRATAAVGSPEYEACSRQLERLASRRALLMRALRTIYGALAAFAASALIAVAGSAMALYNLEPAFRITAAVGFVTGVYGVGALVWGCGLMVQETRLAIRGIAEEVELMQQ